MSTLEILEKNKPSYLKGVEIVAEDVSFFYTLTIYEHKSEAEAMQQVYENIAFCLDIDN